LKQSTLDKLGWDLEEMLQQESYLSTLHSL
jgi:hypothetical protein